MTNISYQLYSSRNFYPVENAITMIAKHGCKEAEGVAGFIIKDNPADTEKELTAIKNALDKNGMTMPTLHIGVALVESHADTLIKIAKTLGCHTLFIAYLEHEKHPTTADGWRQYGADLKSIVQPLIDAGLDVGWHNHEFEFVPVDGSYPMAEMIKGFPELKLEMDIAWVAEANADPIAEMEKFSDNLIALHVKDKAPAGQNEDQDGWCNIGEGVINWGDILVAAKKNPNIKYFVLEHDNPKSDLEFASVSTPYLQKLLNDAGY